MNNAKAIYMKRGTYYISILVLVAVLLNACSLEKRHYRRGYNVHVVKKEAAVTAKSERNVKTKPAEAIKIEGATETAQATTMDAGSPSATVNTPQAEQQAQPAKEVKTKAKAAATASPVKKGNKDFLGTLFSKIKNKTLPNGTGPAGILGGDKLVAILFCIFLGWLGIHRFYLGYPLSAIIMILLFVLSAVGGFFIVGFLGYLAGLLLFVWIIVDLIFLILDKPLFFAK